MDIDYQKGVKRVEELHTQISEEPLDLDIKAFCLARILSTLYRAFPDQKQRQDQVEKEFHATFYALLENSAKQYEILHETLGAFVEYNDPQKLDHKLRWKEV